MLENYQEEGNQGGNKDNIDKVHLEGGPIELEDNGMKGDRCINCGKKGHFARDCKSSQVEGNVVTFTNNDSEEEWNFQASFAIEENDQALDVEVPTSCLGKLKQETAFVMTSNKSINYHDDWIMDSGCSNHMIGDMNKLQSMIEYKEDQVVVMANNFEMSITHIGITIIARRFSLHKVQLQNVFHVSGMTKNLLPVPQLTSSRNYVVFRPNDVKVYRSLTTTSPLLMEGRRLEFVHVMSAQDAYIDKTRKNETVDL